MELKIYTDGGSRGNPGIAGGGVVVENQGEIIFEKSVFFGQKTNNEAEYLAFLTALEWLVDFSAKNQISKVDFFLDSKLVVEQINKNWKIKEDRLKKLVNEAWTKLVTLPYPIKITHVLRNKNAVADALANQAMDSYSEV